MIGGILLEVVEPDHELFQSVAGGTGVADQVA